MPKLQNGCRCSNACVLEKQKLPTLNVLVGTPEVDVTDMSPTRTSMVRATSTLVKMVTSTNYNKQ